MLTHFRKISILATFWSTFALAASSVPIRGKVIQIKDGKVEIQNSSGTSRVIFKKLSQKNKDKVLQAQQKRKEIQLNVTLDMLAKK